MKEFFEEYGHLIVVAIFASGVLGAFTWVFNFMLNFFG